MRTKLSKKLCLAAVKSKFLQISEENKSTIKTPRKSMFFLLLTAFFIKSSCDCQIVHEPEIMQLLQEHQCGFTFRNQSFGILSTPGYPTGYGKNISCQWRIQLPPGSRVVINVKTFLLDQTDKLEIIDGEATQLFSMNNPPNDILFLETNDVIIRLTSEPNFNNTSQKHSFYAIFEREGCGGVMTDFTGFINVPFYIHSASIPHECIWTVISPKNKVVTLEFLQFDLPPGSCIYNTVYVRDGDKNGGYVLGDFCEENPPFNQLRTSTNIMFISYRTRPNLLASKVDMIPNIKMIYKIVDACGGELGGYSGLFSTPQRWIDGVYTCNWTITVPQQRQIILKIRNWKVLASPIDEYDEVKIILPNFNDSVIWQSSGSGSLPPEYFLLQSNQIILSIASKRQVTSYTKIQFKGFYQAVKTTERHCFNAENRLLYMCNEWNYINCTQKCDGKRDCNDGKDENNCQNVIFNTVTKPQENKYGLQEKYEYLVLVLCAVGITIAIILVTAFLNRFSHKNKETIGNRDERELYRKLHKRSVFNLPPPYSEVDTPPPAYLETVTATSNEIVRQQYSTTELFHDTDIIESTRSNSLSSTVNVSAVTSSELSETDIMYLASDDKT